MTPTEQLTEKSLLAPKYAVEPVLEYSAVDRFLLRAKDICDIEKWILETTKSRLSTCKVYLIGRRPRLDIIPDSVRITDNELQLKVTLKVHGKEKRAQICINRSAFMANELTFEASPYPHREIVSKDAAGETVSTTLLANHAHLVSGLPAEARRSEILYVGQGVSDTATDRLKNHSTLQQILADTASNQPDDEVFCLLYSFEKKLHILTFHGHPAKTKRSRKNIDKILNWKPPLDHQVSMVEGALVAYFQTSDYNKNLLTFPQKHHRCVRDVFNLDLPAIVVNIDNSPLGELELGNARVSFNVSHQTIVDFREREGNTPFRELYGGNTPNSPVTVVASSHT